MLHHFADKINLPKRVIPNIQRDQKLVAVRAFANERASAAYAINK